MNLEKRYKMQVEINKDLRSQIEELKAENQRLRKENEWSKVVAESDSKDLKEVAAELEKIYDKFKSSMAEIKKKQKEMEQELRLARKDRAKYRKRMDRLLDGIRKDQNIEIDFEAEEESDAADITDTKP